MSCSGVEQLDVSVFGRACGPQGGGGLHGPRRKLPVLRLGGPRHTNVGHRAARVRPAGLAHAGCPEG
eukprot:scaffold58897_cov15-Prasinocladus_malaysianus.AAC.1